MCRCQEKNGRSSIYIQLYTHFNDVCGSVACGLCGCVDRRWNEYKQVERLLSVCTIFQLRQRCQLFTSYSVWIKYRDHQKLSDNWCMLYGWVKQYSAKMNLEFSIFPFLEFKTEDIVSFFQIFYRLINH